MIPRGTPDLSWSDLGAGLLGCFSPEDGAPVQRRVEARWTPQHNSLACLSVRSGFDLVLQALALPAGSEIIVSALTIRDMCHIIKHHGLVAVPVDLDPDTLGVDVAAVERLIGPRTRAILVAHLFGSRMALDRLVDIARTHRLLVLEDCAQAYDGSAYRGHPQSNVSMFSFGPIKTSTALGGALLRFSDQDLLNTVRQRQVAYPTQKRREFVRRVLLYAVLKLLAHPFALLLFVTWCRLRGHEHDQVLSHAMRGFAGRDLIGRLRRRPSTPLLRLLERRLRGANPGHIAWRRLQAQRIADALPAIRRPGTHASSHAHWVLPIESSAPDTLVRLLWACGFDATRHASSLTVVDPPTEHAVPATNMAQMMERLLYLPMHPGMQEHERARLARIVDDFETAHACGGRYPPDG